jgi:hypothetical protein
LAGEVGGKGQGERLKGISKWRIKGDLIENVKFFHCSLKFPCTEKGEEIAKSLAQPDLQFLQQALISSQLLNNK